MKKITLALGAATALALAGGAAVYAAPAMMGKDMTRAEAAAKAGEMWAKLDVNGDGVLNQADRDARRTQMFDRMDGNKDGSVTREEFAAARPGRGGERGGDHAGMAGHEGPRMGGKHHGGRGHHGGMGRMLVGMADTNRDGSVTRAEYDSAVVRHFDQVDTDRNGTITPAEREAAHAAMKQRMEQMRAAPSAAPSSQ